MAAATTPEQDTPTRWDGGEPADLLADLRWAARQPSARERGPVICSPAQAGAKGPALVVRREGGVEAAKAAERDPAPTRYDGANGGADQWRWTPRGEAE